MKRMRTYLASALLVAAAASAAQAAQTPRILTDKSNKVPACVSPSRLMAFVKSRHKTLPAKLNGIAAAYKAHGDELNVRWDYAFYQMIVETNWLRFYAPGGRPGDVSPSQNNFAGLGATGKRAPGESFASVDKGVEAHLHHMMLYAGTPVENPVADRTKLVTDLILPWAQSLKRPVTFTDLTTRWAPGSRHYSKAIESVATMFRDGYCKGAAPAEEEQQVAVADEAAPAKPAKPAKPAAKVAALKVAQIKVPVEKPAADDVAAEAEPAAPAAEAQVNEAPAETVAVPAAAPAPEAEVAEVAPVTEPAANDEPALAGPALKAAASAEPAAVAQAEEQPPASEAPARVAAEPAKPKGKPAAPAVSAVAGKVIEADSPEAENLQAAATVTEPAEPKAEPDAAADIAKLDNAEALPEAEAQQIAEIAPPDEGDGEGGAVEVTRKPAAKAVAKAATAMFKTASAGDIPAFKSKAPLAKAVATPAETDTAATVDAAPEDAAANTQTAALSVVPDNPAPQGNCKVFTASYGGGMSILIQSPEDGRMRFTALTVNEAKADTQAKAFINVYAKAGKQIGSFGTQNEALTKAFELCPEG